MADFVPRDKKHAVVYQIYIRSFCDSNGDGIGDLPGITSKLDYLAKLGIDYLWITPFYPSPMRDNGYDISDYTAVDPTYGTMDDFDELVAEAKKRHIGIMLDMVLCHTSRDHPWFQKAIAGDKEYQQYYFLKDGCNSKGPGDPGEPPTNWKAAFGGSAWEWEPHIGKWYLHLHDVSQPDLNWDNSKIRKEVENVVLFWKKRGVAGFRFDVINFVSKPAKFVDDTEGAGRPLFADGPHIHEYLQELVSTTGIDGMLTVGEMASTTLDNCIKYSNPDNHELAETFSFHHLKVDYANGDKWALKEADIAKLREILYTWQRGMQEGGGWNALFWDNHDQPRAVTRFGGRAGEGEPNSDWEHVGKMLATTSFFLEGTPYIYEGDELGMTNAHYAKIDQYNDVESLNFYQILLKKGETEDEALHVLSERSRDNGRTPMQWSDGHAAGFTTGKPWLASPANYTSINAEAEVDKPGSIFEYYRNLVHLRHKLEVLATGKVTCYEPGDEAPKVLLFERQIGDIRVVVTTSFDQKPCTVDASKLNVGELEPLVFNYKEAPQIQGDGTIALKPYEACAWITKGALNK